MIQNNETIFISFASVNDSEIYESVKNAFSAANNPDRIFIGVGLLDKNEDNYNKLKSLKNPNIKINYEKFNKNLLGVGKGRMRAQSLFNNEDYFLQLDAHSHFNDGWDNDIISLYKEAKEYVKSDKIIITCIPATYKYFPERIQDKDKSCAIYPSFRKLSLWPGKIPHWASIKFKEWGEYPNKFYPAVKASSALMFGDTEFGKNTGIDENAIFYDEEMIYSINLFGDGYSFVFPNIDPFPISHLFFGDINEYGGHRDFWTKDLSEEEKQDMVLKMEVNYQNFINDKKNRENVRKYEKYAKISARHGSPIDVLILKDFTNEK